MLSFYWFIKIAHIVCAPGNSSDCEAEGSGHHNYLPIFIVSQLLMSIGGAAVYTLSVPLLDESVRRRDSALYIGWYIGHVALFYRTVIGCNVFLGGLCMLKKGCPHAANIVKEVQMGGIRSTVVALVNRLSDRSCTGGMIHNTIYLISPGCPRLSVILHCRIVA